MFFGKILPLRKVCLWKKLTTFNLLRGANCIMMYIMSHTHTETTCLLCPFPLVSLKEDLAVFHCVILCMLCMSLCAFFFSTQNPPGGHIFLSTIIVLQAFPLESFSKKLETLEIFAHVSGASRIYCCQV